MSDNLPCIVFDNGSGIIKAGLAGNKDPKVVFPAVVGRSKSQQTKQLNPFQAQKNAYVGNHVKGLRGNLKVNHPIQRGIIINWDDMEEIWSQTITELKASLDHPILLTENPLNPTVNKEKMAEIVFESLHGSALCIANESLLSLYATERTNGIVLDSGYDVTTVVPVTNGSVESQAILQLDFAGKQLDDYLIEMLQSKAHFDASTERIIEHDVKENLCFIALNYEEEIAKATSSSSIWKSHKLPDGSIININEERIKCPEILFQPSLLNLDQEGVHQTIYKSIMKCEKGVRSDLFSNVILAGGSTKFPGFDNRLHRELTGIQPNTEEVNILAKTNREYLAWIGGSKFACSSSFKETLISREEYKDNGTRITLNKCL